MGLFGLKLNSLLVIAVAALLALGAISAFADDAPGDPPGDGVTVDDGDTDGEGEGHAFGRGHGQGKPDGVPPNDGDVGVLEEHGDGPNPDRGCTTVLDTGGLTLAEGGTSEDGVAMARNRLLGFLDEGSPADQGLDGVQNALEKMCHGYFASAGTPEFGDGDGGESGDHPGNGNAFGRGHGQGKPEGVPTNDGGEE